MILLVLLAATAMVYYNFFYDFIKKLLKINTIEHVFVVFVSYYNDKECPCKMT